MPKKPAKKKGAPVKKKTAAASPAKQPGPDSRKAADFAIANLEKQFGKGCVMRLGDSPLEKVVGVVSTGSISLDRALGVGGLPYGRVVEILGPESCLASESYLPYEVWKGSKRLNHKGGTILRLYERFHGVDEGGSKQGRCFQTPDVEFYVKSVDGEGRVLRNLVLDVVKTGRKPCFRIETETGEVLYSTAEHKYMTPAGFIPLSDLEVGSEVYIHNNTRVKRRKRYLNRPEIFVKYHPHWPVKIIQCKKTGYDYPYHRGQTSRAAYEAHLNGMTLHRYKEFLDTQPKEEIKKLTFLPEDVHVHHIDENFNNNVISNLQLIDPSEHGKIHSKDRIRNLSFIVVPSRIVSISEVGDKDTYDLRCEYPYNNYIAEGIVVHNSGKTTLALQVIANAQQKGAICAFIDAEHALDIDYASALGVDIDELLLSQPDCGEQALEVTEQFVSSGGIRVIVVDSVAALTPRAELEGEMGDHHLGVQARLMSQALRKLTATVHRNKAIVIFINQIRMKIGVRFGSPETTTGGNALKFYSSVRLDIRRIGAIKQGASEDAAFIGNRTRVKVVKNKVAPPFRKAEFDIMYGKGVSLSGDILDLAVAEGKVDKSGAWYSWEGERIGQGRENAKTFLEVNPDIMEAIRLQLEE
jgi:recombination protein RecA